MEDEQLRERFFKAAAELLKVDGSLSPFEDTLAPAITPRLSHEAGKADEFTIKYASPTPDELKRHEGFQVVESKFRVANTRPIRSIDVGYDLMVSLVSEIRDIRDEADDQKGVSRDNDLIVMIDEFEDMFLSGEIKEKYLQFISLLESNGNKLYCDETIVCDKLGQDYSWEDATGPTHENSVKDVQDRPCKTLSELRVIQNISDTNQDNTTALTSLGTTEPVLGCHRINATRWSELSIVFVNEQTIEIHCQGTVRNITFYDLGFSDGRRKDTPNKQWALLKIFADGKGDISPQSDIAKDVSILRNGLKKALQSIPDNDNPIVFDKELRTYKTSFGISSRIRREDGGRFQNIRSDVLAEFSPEK